jgi:hypothetical protein
MNPRAGLDDVEKRTFLILPGFELRPLGHPARSLSLYRLSYPCSSYTNIKVDNLIRLIQFVILPECGEKEVLSGKRALQWP